MMAIVGCLTYEFQTTLPLLAGNTFHGDAEHLRVPHRLHGRRRRRRRPHRRRPPETGCSSRLVNTAVAVRVWSCSARRWRPRWSPRRGPAARGRRLLGHVPLPRQLHAAARGRAGDAGPGHVALVGGVPRFHPDRRTAGRLRRRRLGARYGLGLGGVAALAAAGYGWVALRHRETARPAETPGGSGASCPFLPWRGRGGVASRAMLFLVRHGRTAHNASRRLLGRLDVPLDELGRRQAEALGRVPFLREAARVVSSPLSRAVETAAALGPPVSVDERWVEIDYGIYDGAASDGVPGAVRQVGRRPVIRPGGRGVAGRRRSAGPRPARTSGARRPNTTWSWSPTCHRSRRRWPGLSGLATRPAGGCSSTRLRSASSAAGGDRPILQQLQRHLPPAFGVMRTYRRDHGEARDQSSSTATV